MAFRPLGETQEIERGGRSTMRAKAMSLGIEFLDDGLLAIFPDDLILVGAPPGIGKTQLCCIFAMANVNTGKRVHYIALEASEYEIDRRLKYPIVAKAFFDDPNRPVDVELEYDTWLLGVYDDQLDKYEEHARIVMKEAYKNLHVMYKQGTFGVSQLIEAVLSISGESDLIILDHAQYFDYDEDKANRALKEIVSTARDLALEEQVPIVLVSHLRKKDKFGDDLIADLEEFHGSSDLAKIATRVITLAGGRPTSDGNYETFFRINKNRINGGAARYAAALLFSPTKGSYEPEYQIGWAEQSRKLGFRPLDKDIPRPSWIGRSSLLRRKSNKRSTGQLKNHADEIRPRTIPYNPSDN